MDYQMDFVAVATLLCDRRLATPESIAIVGLSHEVAAAVSLHPELFHAAAGVSPTLVVQELKELNIPTSLDLTSDEYVAAEETRWDEVSKAVLGGANAPATLFLTSPLDTTDAIRQYEACAGLQANTAGASGVPAILLAEQQATATRVTQVAVAFLARGVGLAISAPEVPPGPDGVTL